MFDESNYFSNPIAIPTPKPLRKPPRGPVKRLLPRKMLYRPDRIKRTAMNRTKPNASDELAVDSTIPTTNPATVIMATLPHGLPRFMRTEMPISL